MEDIKYCVAEEFSKTPSARTADEGKHPGADLRAIIVPMIRKAIDNGVKFLIDLDYGAGYGTSFLEEVFGGLVREENFTFAELDKVLIIKSDEEPELIEEIWQDIKDADDEKS